MSPAVRVVPWTPLVAAVVAGGATLVVVRGVAGDTPASCGESFRIAALLLAATAGFAVDDAARELLAPVPVALWRRRLDRLAPVAAGLLLGWVLLVGLASRLFPTSWPLLDRWEGSLQAAAVATSSVALAALVAFRRPGATPGIAAAGLVLGATTTGALTERLHPPVAPEVTSVLVVVLAVSAAALLSTSDT